MNGALVVSAFLLGLAGSGHCAVMCGGASGWVLRAVAPEPGALARFHLGRIAGYAALGAVVALAGAALQRAALYTGALRPLWTMANAAAFALGAVLLVTGRQPGLVSRVGQSFGRLFAARRAGAPAAAGVATVAVSAIGRAGGGVGGSGGPGGVARSGETAGSGGASGRRGAARAWAAGACWAFMPCGLLYSALLLATLSGDPGSASAAMAAFALAGAGPLLAAQRLLRGARWLPRWERWGNRAVGAAICALAGWGVWAVLAGGQGLFCLPGAG